MADATTSASTTTPPTPRPGRALRGLAGRLVERWRGGTPDLLPSRTDAVRDVLGEAVRLASGSPTPQELSALLARLAEALGLTRVELLTCDTVVREDPSRQQTWSSDGRAHPGPPAPQDLLLCDPCGQTLGLVRTDGIPDSDGTDVLRGALGIVLDQLLAARAIADSRQETVRAHAQLTDQRQRTAAAMDRTRRSLEHDLHDGAQGDLVALGMRIRLRRTLHGADLPPDVRLPEPAELLREAHALRDRIAGTAAGLTPARLADGGLPAALRHELPTDDRGRLDIVLADDLDRRRFPTEIEATVYFICAEAVLNARKHAPGSDVRVEVHSTYRGVELVVTDTGPGFDGSPGPGAFRALRERAAAASGTLEVTSSVSHGTVVRAAIPC